MPPINPRQPRREANTLGLPVANRRTVQTVYVATTRPLREYTPAQQQRAIRIAWQLHRGKLILTCPPEHA